MKNIPLFTSESGVASLILEEVSYKKEAYVRIHDSSKPIQFIDECAAFCYAAGANSVYLTGTDIPDKYPLYTRIINMECDRSLLPETDAELQPVSADTIDEWRNIYNNTMRFVPCSSTLTIQASRDILQAGTAYFVIDVNGRVGIGAVSNNKIDAIAACVRGTGKRVFLALNKAVTGRNVCVDVSDINTAAMRLYNSLGFHFGGEVIRWYRYIKDMGVK